MLTHCHITRIKPGTSPPFIVFIFNIPCIFARILACFAVTYPVYALPKYKLPSIADFVYQPKNICNFLIIVLESLYDFGIYMKSSAR